VGILSRFRERRFSRRLDRQIIRDRRNASVARTPDPVGEMLLHNVRSTGEIRATEAVGYVEPSVSLGLDVGSFHSALARTMQTLDLTPQEVRDMGPLGFLATITDAPAPAVVERATEYLRHVGSSEDLSDLINDEITRQLAEKVREHPVVVAALEEIAAS
jgi:hypothetical protein